MNEVIVRVVEEVIKHLPTRHNQKDHGRKRRVFNVGGFRATDLSDWRRALPALQKHADIDVSIAADYGSHMLESSKAFSLKDSSGKAQVAFSLRDEETYMVIGWLAVAPWNLRGVKERVSGWGAAAMYSIAKIALSKNRIEKILLNVDNVEAAKFYRAIGMKETRGHAFTWSRPGIRKFIVQYEKRHDIQE